MRDHALELDLEVRVDVDRLRQGDRRFSPQACRHTDWGREAEEYPLDVAEIDRRQAEVALSLPKPVLIVNDVLLVNSYVRRGDGISAM